MDVFAAVIFLFFVFSIYGFGQSILNLFKLNLIYTSEKIAFAIGFGTVFFALISVVIVWSGLVYPIIFWIVLSLGFLLWLKHIKHLRYSFTTLYALWKNSSIVTQIIFLVVLFIIAIMFTFTYLPNYAFDTRLYHYSVPKNYVDKNCWYYSTERIYTFLTGYSHFLYVWGFVLHSETLVNMICFFSSLIPMFSIYAFSKRFFSERTGILCCILYFFSPKIMYSTVSGGTHSFDIFFFVLFMHTMFLSINELKMRILIVAGVLSGYSVASKLPGAVSFFILSFFFIYYFLRRINNKEGDKKACFLKLGILYLTAVITSVIIISPTLITKYNAAGNPIFPFFHSWFSEKKMSLTNLNKENQVKTGEVFHLFWGLVNVSYHTGRYLLPPVLFLPFLLKGVFEKKNYGWMITVFVMISMFIFVAPYSRITEGLQFVAKLYDLIRYSSPMLIMLFIPASYEILDVYEKLKKAKFFSLVSRLICCFLLSGYVILGSVIFFSESLESSKRLQVIAGTMSMEEYINEVIPDYKLRDLFRENDKVLIIGLGSYYVKGNIVEVSPTLDPVNFDNLHSNQDFIKRLKELNIGYVVINKKRNYMSENFYKFLERVGGFIQFEGITIMYEDKNFFVIKVVS